MEAALTPGSIAWGSVGLIVGGDDPSVHGPDVGDVANYLLTTALRGANSFGHPLLAAVSKRSWNRGRATRSGRKARAARLATVAWLSDGSLEAYWPAWAAPALLLVATISRIRFAASIDA